MPSSRLTQFWNERPWKKRKDEVLSHKADSVITFEPAVDTKDEPIRDLPIAIDARRPSRFFKNDRSASVSAPSRSSSIRQLARRRSLFRRDEPVLVDNEEDQIPLPPPLERESMLKRIQRRSQSFSLPRPSSSGSIFRRHTTSTTDGDNYDREVVPEVPTLPELFLDNNRPRHVPISIDYLRSDLGSTLPVFGPGVALTSNDVQSPSPLSAHRARNRPASSSSNFSQIRTRPAQRHVYQHAPMLSQSSESSDDDVITALPSMDFKDFHLGELSTPLTHTPSTVPVRLRRGAPKVVEILAPRPLSIFSSQPKKSASPTQQRHKSLAPVLTTPIGTLEDGPKGDWSRTRHSWMGTGAEFEQMEWDKLKQFMEAYGSGQQAGIVSVRAVGTDSSSGSARNSDGAKFSNAQALAALEFGL